MIIKTFSAEKRNAAAFLLKPCSCQLVVQVLYSLLTSHHSSHQRFLHFMEGKKKKRLPRSSEMCETNKIPIAHNT